MNNYTVKQGDTLYGISNQFGVSVSDILNNNNVDPSNLKIGQVLIIPNNNGTNADTTINYTVKKGDSLYALAKKYNTTVPKIIELNNLKNSNLSIGQIIKIPENYTSNNNDSKPQFINYTVKKGDSLYEIAKKNNIDVSTLKKDNGLTSNNLSIGQVLQIRTDNNLEIEECFGEEFIPESNEEYKEYTVIKGDSLYKIAKQNNITVDQIINLNNLKNTNLSIGQKLKIPYQVTPISNEYIVKKGDSLYSIAREYNTTPDEIKRKNNLTSNVLSIGQKLKV